MFYLARLIASSSHSLATTIGYATGDALGWRGRMEPGTAGMPSPAQHLPPHPSAPAPLQQRRTPAPYRPFNRWRFTWTAETF
jgi:hypothetical protein